MQHAYRIPVCLRPLCLALATGLLTVTGSGAAGQVNSTLNLMPVPVQLTAGTGIFRIDTSFRLKITGRPHSRFYGAAGRFIRRLGERTGIFLDGQGFVRATDSSRSASLQVSIDAPGRLAKKENESYGIDISPGRVMITAATDLGAIHALETLLQLVSADASGFYFPALTLSDEPRFAWRGLQLDVVCHFMPVDMIKRTLDGMAAVKLNVLHLTLSNDQGFRVESRVFPGLNTLGSDGQYYRQSEIKDIIAYAGERGIRVVPEFVVPAHTTAILAAFPELASKKRQYQPERYFGVFDPVLDPTNEKTWLFLDRLFTEMTALFPDSCFHIGGDENTGKDWLTNPRIKEYMDAHGMKEYMDLQTAFNRRLLPLVEKHGKTMMGWDEILQPGVPKNIIIQSWRGNSAFYKSVKSGYTSILSYGYYIDLIQPAGYHYANDPVPDSAGLSAAETARILGGEATMWSEMITPETADSRIWPRTAAIAERLWSPQNIKDPEDMYRRLDIVSPQLEYLGLRHRSFRPVMLRRLCNGGNTVALENLVDVIEPLKIYQRNEGDTMYTVFSPFTKLADAATPDQPLPRLFLRDVRKYLSVQDDLLADEISGQLTVWKNNDSAFQRLTANAPGLKEGAVLSSNLSALAAAGREAMAMLRNKRKPDAGWLTDKEILISKAKESGGRCTLEIVTPIAALITAAGAL